MGVVPAIEIERAGNAISLANAMKAGGLPCAEIIFRTIAVEDSIRVMNSSFPDTLAGAGTVRSVQQAVGAV